MSRRRGRVRRRRGNTLVEMALIAVLLFLMLFAMVEFGRMALVYANIANAARVGARYAIVHGATNTGSGASGANGPGATAEIESIVKDYTKGGLLDTTRMNITVTYPDGGLNTPGSRVTVQVRYPYDPFTVLPLEVTLGSETTGVITF
jgi:Flp pilus assembly protein TadG